jgi:cobalt-zinc-cadmium efflux system membrane fusion protein
MKLALILAICCGMTLAGCKSKKDAPESTEKTKEASNLVEMSVSAQKHIGMVVAPAEDSQLNEYLRTTGTVQPIDSRVGIVASLARGRIVEVRAKVGDRVQAGQTLAVFDNVEAGELLAQERAGQADLERLKAQLIPAARQMERSRRLADIGAGSEKEFESSRAEKEGIDASIRSQQALIEGLRQHLHRFGISEENPRSNYLTSLQAPFGGVVTKAQVSPGDTVETGKEVFTVADLQRIWVQAEVYEKDLGRLSVGQSAYITVDTYPNHPFEGKVAYISDVLDPQTRTARVRCEVANPQMQLKTDMFANVELPTKLTKQALAVPAAALQQVEGKNVVFVRRSEDTFEKREVEKGVTVKDQVEIVSGLKPGEPIVTQGAFHLKSILAGGELGEE